MQLPDLIVDPASSWGASLTEDAQLIASKLERGRLYVLVSTVPCLIAQGAEPSAKLGRGSVLVPAGVERIITGTHGPLLSIRALGPSSPGYATITRLDRV